jgi:hypothetical protein
METALIEVELHRSWGDGACGCAVRGLQRASAPSALGWAAFVVPAECSLASVLATR